MKQMFNLFSSSFSINKIWFSYCMPCMRWNEGNKCNWFVSKGYKVSCTTSMYLRKPNDAPEMYSWHDMYFFLEPTVSQQCYRKPILKTFLIIAYFSIWSEKKSELNWRKFDCIPKTLRSLIDSCVVSLTFNLDFLNFS